MRVCFPGGVLDGEMGFRLAGPWKDGWRRDEDGVMKNLEIDG